MSEVSKDNEHKHLASRVAKAASIVGITAIILSSCSVLEKNSPTQESARTDLITNFDWKQANIERIGDELVVKDSEQSIMSLDRQIAQENSPVNLFGTHLERKGDFSLDLSLGNIKGEAAINIYGEPPVIEDEFRAEMSTLKVRVTESNVDISASDQTHGQEFVKKQFATPASSKHAVKIIFRGNDLILEIDNKRQNESVALDGLLGNSLWLGLDSRSGPFTLSSFIAEGDNGGKVAAVNSTASVAQQPNGLAALAVNKRPDMLIGAAIAPGPLVSDSKYRELLGNFNAVSIENMGKWQFIHPSLHTYNFSDMDGLVDSSLKSGKRVHGHALIFGEANPRWVQDLSNDPAKLQQAAENHIRTIMTRYRGKVASWDVINEPLADYGTEAGEYGLRKNIWYNTLGPDYIARMLHAAHKADPSAELWINDFGMEADDRRFEQILSLVRRLQAENVPLTGIGFQAHIQAEDTIDNNSRIDTQLLSDRVKQLEALGLKTRFSEVDISNESQHQIPADIIKVCMAEIACRSVTMWGVTDRYSSGGSIDEDGMLHRGTGLLWDASYAETHSVEDIRSVLR